MGINAQITVIYQVTGSIGGSNATTDSMTSTLNTNAPPSSAAQLQPGTNTIAVPLGFTVSLAFIRPPANSSNAKTFGAVLGSWTSAPIVVPVVAGGTIIITSTSAETVEIDYA